MRFFRKIDFGNWKGLKDFRKISKNKIETSKIINLENLRFNFQM